MIISQNTIISLLLFVVVNWLEVKFELGKMHEVQSV